MLCVLERLFIFGFFTSDAIKNNATKNTASATYKYHLVIMLLNIPAKSNGAGARKIDIKKSPKKFFRETDKIDA